MRATFKRSPSEHGELVLGLLEQGGLLVLDDLTPDRPGADAIRDWAFRHPRVTATEVLTTPRTSTLLFARLQCSGPSDPSGGDPVSVQ